MAKLSKEEKKALCFVREDLLKRGWNEELINRFLASPDREVPHPSGKGTIRLYRRERVLEIEGTVEYYRAKRGILPKPDRLPSLERLLETEKIPLLSRKRLLRESIWHYNQLNPQASPARPEYPQNFLNRIQVNYLRHRCTQYEEYLRRTSLVRDRDQAYLLVTEQILRLIAQHYPYLADECYRQIDKKKILSPSEL